MYTIIKILNRYSQLTQWYGGIESTWCKYIYYLAIAAYHLAIATLLSRYNELLSHCSDLVKSL